MQKTHSDRENKAAQAGKEIEVVQMECADEKGRAVQAGEEMKVVQTERAGEKGETVQTERAGERSEAVQGAHGGRKRETVQIEQKNQGAQAEHNISATWAEEAIMDLDDFIESQGVYIRQ